MDQTTLTHRSLGRPANALAAGRSYRYAIRGGRLGVLVALAGRIGNDMPRLTALVRTPPGEVARIAAITDLSTELVLRCLEMVASGITPSRGRSGAIALALASEPTERGRRHGRLRAQRLLADFDFRDVLHEIYQARRGIAVPWSRGHGGTPTDASGDLINDVGERLESSALHSRQLVHLLDGAQAAITRAVAEELGPGGELTADGWTLPTRLDVRMLKRRIQQRTGYRVGIAVKRRKTSHERSERSALTR